MDSEYDEQEDYYAKCGELFLTVKGNIAFHCTLCENIYKNFEDYNGHILDVHYSPVFKEELSDSIIDEENSFNPLSTDDYSVDTESLIANEDEEIEIYVTPEEIVVPPCEDLPQDNSTGSNVLPNPIATVPSHLTKKEAIRYKLGRGNLNPKITDRKYKCPLCDFTCGDKSNIKGHIRRHSLHKPHQCTECQKAFHTRTELNTHNRTHTGERPYLCTLCGQAFTTASKLSKHQKRHYNIRDKECPICKMRFFGTNSLRSHMAVHSEKRNFKCEQCDASFKIPLSLKNHMKLHENKRQYQCKLCDSRFNQHAGLYSHMKNTHTLVKPTSELNN